MTWRTPRLAAAWRLLCAIALLCAVAQVARAAPHGPFNRPGERWRVAETRYFRVYYSDETPASAARILEIADQTFERLNAFYGYRPSDKIGVTIVGYTGFSNGYAEPGRNRITIYTTPANFHTRNRAPWLENVFTHELSHILSLNAATPWSSRVPVVVGSGVARSAEAEGLLRLPLFTGNHPHWFSEGVAQFDTALAGRDAFDENRSAFERAALEDGLFYSLDKLAFFGDEKWYNTGFSFLSYLERRFGSGTVHRIFRRAGERYDLVFSAVFANVLGLTLDELERDFRAEIDYQLARHLARVDGGRYDGSRIGSPDESPPFEVLTPVQRERSREAYSGRALRYFDGRVFFRRGELIHFARLAADGRTFEDERPIGEGVSIARHGEQSWFVLRQEGHTPALPSLYRPEFESPSLFLVQASGEERRLLAESRLSDIDVCSEKKQLAGIYNDGDGSLRLALYALEGNAPEQVRVVERSLSFPLPPQFFDEVRSPRYSPDCSKLFFSRRVGDDHGIYYYDFERRIVLPFVDEDAFELYPDAGADGLYFVSTRDGTMSVYRRGYDGGAIERVTKAITSHHYPLTTPRGVVFARLRGTGFHPYYLDRAGFSGERVMQPRPKPDRALRTRAPTVPHARRDYAAFSPRDWVAPSLVPLLDMEYDYSPAAAQRTLRAQAGLELYLEDQLRTHALWFRGFVGNRNSAFLSYRNDMTALTLEARLGYSQDRAVYTYARADGQSFEHVTDGRWGFVYGSASLPLDLFTRVGIYGESIRDLGTTRSAQARNYHFTNPRYGRDLGGAFAQYAGIDRSDPAFRERWVNKRGYRELDLRAAYAVEEIDGSLAAYALPVGRRPYLRAELEHREYLALPTLARGSFDHTLELNLKLGYIGRDIQFLPFYGGGRLYSQTTAELNTSVGFAGYGSYALSGETLVNLSVTYRFPILRGLSFDWGPFYLEDIYAQLFTSWGNLWGFDPGGRRQRPFFDRAPNGRHLVGDIGADVRLFSFFQEVESNMGTTLRLAYRAVPFARCPSGPASADCPGVNGRRGLMGYVMIGAGF
jgi:hypothetical protein